jgi:predicted phosphodiesterase
MKVQDLGDLPGEVLLFGGPYSNLPATRALIKLSHARDIPATHVICTGDVVAYCGQPVETVAALRALGGPIIAGNCEKQLANDAPDCGCGFDAGTACDLLSAGWYGYARAQIDADTRAFMGALPDLAVFTQAGKRFAVLHGGVTDISRFLWPSSPASAFEDELAALTKRVGPVDGVIAGHCGIPFHRRIGQVDWINVGVIGMPPNDGQPDTRFALLKEAQATIHTLAYDAPAAAAAMQAVGLTQGYHRGLLTGHWPSEEVLPPDMRRDVPQT